MLAYNTARVVSPEANPGQGNKVLVLVDVLAQRCAVHPLALCCSALRGLSVLSEGPVTTHTHTEEERREGRETETIGEGDKPGHPR